MIHTVITHDQSSSEALNLKEGVDTKGDFPKKWTAVGVQQFFLEFLLN